MGKWLTYWEQEYLMLLHCRKSHSSVTALEHCSPAIPCLICMQLHGSLLIARHNLSTERWSLYCISFLSLTHPWRRECTNSQGATTQPWRRKNVIQAITGKCGLNLWWIILPQKIQIKKIRLPTLNNFIKKNPSRVNPGHMGFSSCRCSQMDNKG